MAFLGRAIFPKIAFFVEQPVKNLRFSPFLAHDAMHHKQRAIHPLGRAIFFFTPNTLLASKLN